MDDGMDEIVREFLVESHENLDQIDVDLVALERDPHSGDRLARVFRAVHTIKGTSGFLGLPLLESVAHAGETLLASLRDGDLLLTTERASLLLATVDAIREILTSVETGTGEGSRGFDGLVADLHRSVVDEVAPAAEPAPAVEPAPAPATEDPGVASVPVPVLPATMAVAASGAARPGRSAQDGRAPQASRWAHGDPHGP